MPVADVRHKPRLVLLGDELTQGDPVYPSASFAAALAEANPGIMVDNAGFGGLCSAHLPDPKAFSLPLPSPGNFHCWAVCIFVGTNDAMAMCGHEDWVDGAYASTGLMPRERLAGSVPSMQEFERSLGEGARAFLQQGARVALVTPPPLGEDMSTDIHPGLRGSPAAVLQAIATSVHRVASTEGCTVLPLFECSELLLKAQEHKRASGPRAWTPADHDLLRRRSMARRKEEWMQSRRILPWVDAESETEGGSSLCHDLVHLNERGAAIFAALCQAWLDVERNVPRGRSGPGAACSSVLQEAMQRVPGSLKGRHADFFKQLYLQPALCIPWDIQGPQPDLVNLQRERPEAFESPLLDLGAGLGGNSIWLAGSLGLSVVACDVSAEALEQARGRWAAALAQLKRKEGEALLRFVQCDALSEPLPRVLVSQGPFATLLDSAVFHCIGDVEDQRRYVRALTSLVRPGGHLVMLAFSDHNRSHEAEQWQGPRRVSQEDLHGYFCASSGWNITEVRECRYCCASSQPPHGMAYAGWLMVARRLGETL